MAKFGDIEYERRVFPRFILHLPFTYQLDEEAHFQAETNPESVSTTYDSVDDRQPPGSGLTVNASQSGLQIYLPEKMKEGTVLNLKLSLTEQHEIRYIETKAQIVWITKSTLQAPRLFKAGVRFINITEEALSFLKWFEQLWLEQSS